MGLDMYINVRKNAYKSFSIYDKQKGVKDETYYPDDLNIFKDYIMANHAKVTEITTQYMVGYFRKFNALHHHIVETYADGNDDCTPVYLYQDAVEEIRNRLKQVLDDHSKAEEMLPPCEGFFFGSTEIDEYYFKDVESAYYLFDMLANIDFTKYDVIYQASW